MERLRKRKKLFSRVIYTLIGFVAVALLIVGGFYNGIFFGIPLSLIVWPLVLLEVIIAGFIMKMVMEEEKLEASPQ